MKISVYVTSYNQKAELIEAIDSVLDQTLKPFQIIIIDDHSSDGSQEVIESYANRFPDLIAPIFHDQNLGVGRTRSDALHAVTGDHVTYLDGDDRYLPTKLEMQAKILQADPRAEIVYCNDRYIRPNGDLFDFWTEDPDLLPEGDLFPQVFAWDFPKRIPFCMELINFEAWKRIGFYDQNLRIYEDWDQRLRLTKAYRVACCREALTETRIHHRGLSSSKFAVHLSAVRYIYGKNRDLLDDHPDRHAIETKFQKWLAKIERRAAWQAFEEGDRDQSRDLCLESLRHDLNPITLKLLTRSIIPEETYQFVKKVWNFMSE